MSGESAHILLVDDVGGGGALLSRFLTENGFRVTMAETAAEARDKLRFMDFDLMVLDVMMPGESGLDLTASLRREQGHDLPVLLLTARGAPEDRIAGFEAGADDYLGKPFEPRELVLRIRNVLQRRPVIEEPAPTTDLRFGAFRFDPIRSELFRGDELVRLTAAEIALLSSLAQHAPQAVSREELSQSAQFSGNVRNVDVQMTRLRRKVERDPRNPRYLQTVRGTGYALRPD
jgi:two-component system phosphate regulon response regulator OmpR